LPELNDADAEAVFVPLVSLGPFPPPPVTTIVLVDGSAVAPPALFVVTSVDVAAPPLCFVVNVFVAFPDLLALLVVKGFGPPGVPPGGAKDICVLMQTILPTCTVFVLRNDADVSLKGRPASPEPLA
jgi:hypothetical protein